MAYFSRDGDIISTSDEKAGALTMSVPLWDWPGSLDPAELWETQAAVRIVTGEIAREVGSIPIHQYRRTSDTDRVRVATGRLANMLREPIPGVGASRWFEQVTLDLAVHDRWGALIGVNPDTGDWELTRLPAHRIAVAWSGGRPRGLWWRPEDSSGEVLIPLDRVVFDVAPSAMPQDDHHTGSSRLRTIRDLASELNGVQTWRSQVSNNGMRVPAVIERPVEAPEWSDTAFNRFKTQIDAYKRGGGNEGGIPILEDGMKLKPVDVFNPKDFETGAMRQMTLIEACLLYNYPPELLGAREGTYSNIEAFREAKYRDVLGSWIVNLEQALNSGLKRAGALRGTEYVEAQVDAKLRGSFAEEAKAYQAMVGAPIMTRAEARARKNLPYIEGSDELITPLNVLVGGNASPQDTAPDDADRDDDRDPKAGRPGA